MMVQLFPEGFEEREEADGVELAAYTDWSGEERLWQVFGAAQSRPVAEDWAERWRTFHRPVRVGPLWIGPTWLEPDEDAIPVVIDPAAAFGTGAHPTTRLCLAALLGLEERESLLDVGCGSGVLAIGAAKLGFRPVYAVDSDPAAIEATTANAAGNGVDVETRLIDVLDPAAGLPETRVAVANISLDLVERLASGVRSGLVVSSGYLEGEQPALPGFRAVRRWSMEGWAADLHARE